MSLDDQAPGEDQQNPPGKPILPIKPAITPDPTAQADMIDSPFKDSVSAASQSPISQATDSQVLDTALEEDQITDDDDDDERMYATAKRPAIIIPPTPSQTNTESRSEPGQSQLAGTPEAAMIGDTAELKQSEYEHLPLPVVVHKTYANGHMSEEPLPMAEAVRDIEKQSTTRLPIARRLTGALRTSAQGVKSQNVALGMPTSGVPRKPTTAQALREQRRKRMLVRYLSRKHMRQGRIQDERSIKRLWVSLISTFVACLVIFLSVVGVGGYESFKFYTDTQTEFLPRVLALRSLMPKDNLKMYDSQGIPIAQLTSEGSHTTVDLKQISPHLINATVATEDKDFWTNPGLDITRILQAALDDLRHGHVVAGGSTITQQLIKNLILTQDQNFIRKLQEVTITPEVNAHYSKAEIMEMYLNSIYYGHNAYGIDAAASAYFGIEDTSDKPASSQLDIAQAAMLAGIPSSPTSYDPKLHPKAAYARFETVLGYMFKNGYITRAELIDAEQEAQKSDFLKDPPASTQTRAPHFVDFVTQQLESQFKMNYKQLARSGMSVYTTLDVTLQEKIQKIAQDNIAKLSTNPGFHVTNSSVVMIDFHNGAIRTLLGSLDYNNKNIDGQFDVATQGYRQPGSSFKPYVYLAAFENGASPAQTIDDNKLVIHDPTANPPDFIPGNYTNDFYGHMTLRCALQNSLNVPAVKVLQHVGIDKAMSVAKDLGVESYQGSPGYSLVLGGLGVHLLDHTSAYGTFANGGKHVPYYSIDRIVFSNNKQNFGHPKDDGKQVIDPKLAYMMTNVLSDNNSRLPEFYDCNVLQLYANSQQDCYGGNRGEVRAAAVKTGTTNDFRDNLTMGYTTDYVMGVWVGNSDNSPMGPVLGVTGAAPIWHDAMLKAEEGHPMVKDFPNPGGLEQKTVTYPDGLTTNDWFVPGTEPKFTAPPPSAPTAGAGTPAATATTRTGGPGGTAKRPFCSNYSFAFPPPADDYLNGSSPIPGMW